MWSAYKVARAASRYGHHQSAHSIYQKISQGVSSEHLYYWLTGLAQVSLGEMTLINRTSTGSGLATNTIFFLFPFLYKIIDLPGGHINDPSSGNHSSFPLLPATPSSPSRTLEGLFELTQHPHLMRCFRNYRDTMTLSGVPR